VSRAALDRAVLDWIQEGALAPSNDARFNRLALDLFAFQYEHNPAYSRFCSSFGLDPKSVRSWTEIPPVPTGAFKEARLATFPVEQEIQTFRTSGSTTQRRGELHLDTLELYEASLLATLRAYLRPEEDPIRFAVLAPSARDAPDSSLSYMLDAGVRVLGTDESRFYVHAKSWNPERLFNDLADAREPVALVGTAFAFVHFLDFLLERSVRLELPEGSRVMETGGFKGRSRELTREELHGAIEQALSVPGRRIINQYGMCELGSQFYEATLRTDEPTRTKRIPPWVRTRIVDPATLKEAPTGEIGILIHYDLANTGSVLAVQTSDLGRSVQDGFEVLGRAPDAEARGCSLAAEALLGKR
jgi:hypothetical protein